MSASACEAELDAIEARLDARDAAVAAIVAAGERPLLIPGECGGPIAILIHRDTYVERLGQWRLTRFEGDEAIGHSDASSFAAAVRESAAEWRGRLDEATEVVS